MGWVPPVADAGSSSISLDALCALVPTLEKHPAVTIVCLEFGARSAAQKLSGAGLPLVVWMQGSFVRLRAAFLIGMIEPLLRTLHRSALTSEQVRILRCSISCAYDE